ncbi:hypothetical protein FRB90_005816 [Tulasnella sp. 427]|nr:hypothetical protein FRB90_005816 [Tulasnella sp. 427]
MRSLPYTDEGVLEENAAEESYRADPACQFFEALVEINANYPRAVDPRESVHSDSPKIFILDPWESRNVLELECTLLSLYLYEVATQNGYRLHWRPLDIPRYTIQVPIQDDSTSCGPRLVYHMQQYLLHRDQILERCRTKSKETLEPIFSADRAAEMREIVEKAMKSLKKDVETKSEPAPKLVQNGFLQHFIEIANGKKSVSEL